MKENLDKEFWQLAITVLNGEADKQQLQAWDQLLADNSGLDQEFRLVKDYWEKSGSLPYDKIDVEKDWQHVWAKARRSQKRKSFIHTPVFRYAAVIIFCLAAVYILFWFQNKDFTSRHSKVLTTIQAPAGSKTFVTLPDSSKIWLNAGSSIHYDNDFGVNNRKITLEGEAFFDVVKNEQPFKVYTNEYHIAVLGTAFNVKAYKDDNKMITTLVRGSLKINDISTPEGKKHALLRPGQRLTYWKKDAPADGVVLLEGNINTSGETAWKDGWLSVRSESLYELAIKLERLYDIQIQFEDEKLKDYRYTGKIRELSLEQVLKALAMTSPITFTIREKLVTIMENKDAKSKYQRTLQGP